MGPIRSTLPRSRIAGKPAHSARDDLIAAHMPMAAHLARTFNRRGEELDDLTQVAMLELVRAAARFDPARGTTFGQYAYPCIAGALKKHFRDTTWALHVTRRVQELALQTHRGIPFLTQRLGRTPTVPELAGYLQVSEKDVVEGMNSHLAYRTVSLSLPVEGGEVTEVGHLLGSPDGNLEAISDRHTLANYVAQLPARERAIIYMRFTGGLSQREIGERIGLSQMHVSRLLKVCMDRLRVAIAAQR